MQVIKKKKEYNKRAEHNIHEQFVIIKMQRNSKNQNSLKFV